MSIYLLREIIIRILNEYAFPCNKTVYLVDNSTTIQRSFFMIFVSNVHSEQKTINILFMCSNWCQLSNYIENILTPEVFAMDERQCSNQHGALKTGNLHIYTHSFATTLRICSLQTRCREVWLLIVIQVLALHSINENQFHKFP